MKILAITLFLAFAHTSASAAELDLSNRSEPEGKFQVGFCARPSPSARGWPGHAFVSWSKPLSASTRDFKAIGHTVSSGTTASAAAWSIFGTAVHGQLKQELYTSVFEKCLLVTVNKEDFEATERLSEPILKRLGISDETVLLQAYQLSGDDCVSWMIRVAAILEPKGLKVPKRGSLEAPMTFMQRLIAAN